MIRLQGIFHRIAGFFRRVSGRRIRVVLDTNVLIAAITNSRSASAKIVEEAIQGRSLQICLSSEVVSEYEYILRSFRFALKKREEGSDFISVLQSNACFTDPTVRIRRIKDDISDNKFLECAVSAGAKYLITSDRHFNFKIYKGIKVMRPAEMEKELTG